MTIDINAERALWRRHYLKTTGSEPDEHDQARDLPTWLAAIRSRGDGPTEADEIIEFAHSICNAADISPGEIRRRLVWLSERVNKDPHPADLIYQIAVPGSGAIVRWYDVDPEQYATSEPELRRIVTIGDSRAPTPTAKGEPKS